MGKKLNSNALRLGVNKNWSSLWFAASPKVYKANLLEDLRIKKIVKAKLNRAGLDNVIVKRFPGKVVVDAFVARPGVAIGRGGEDIDRLKADLKRLIKKNVEVNIKEVKNADLSARVVARAIADGIAKRQPAKLLVFSFKNKVMSSKGAIGVQIWVSGRIGAAADSRVLKVSEGPVPLQTIRADIDYAEEVAHSLEAGLLGVKVWIYRKSADNLSEK